jgi:hypothetical protein
VAINLDAATARIAWTTSGATAACHTGSQFALLHCTKGANLAAGNRSPAGKVKQFDAVELEGSVFLEATANELDIGDRQFGMVQTTELMFYEFVYAGRRDTEGSCKLDLKAGFTANPSLDVQSGRGQSIDDKVFDFSMLLIDRVTTPKAGFNVTVRFGDHPNNVIPYRFQNGLTGARNYLALAARAQKFNVHLVTRANATSPVEILGRFNWAVDWIVEFAWSVRTGKATATTRRADVLDGVFVKGAQVPSDASSNIVRARSQPTANKQDENAVNAIYNRRSAPLLRESRHWPPGFRTDFFT